MATNALLASLIVAVFGCLFLQLRLLRNQTSDHSTILGRLRKLTEDSKPQKSDHLLITFNAFFSILAYKGEIAAIRYSHLTDTNWFVNSVTTGVRDYIKDVGLNPQGFKVIEITSTNFAKLLLHFGDADHVFNTFAKLESHYAIADKADREYFNQIMGIQQHPSEDF